MAGNGPSPGACDRLIGAIGVDVRTEGLSDVSETVPNANRGIATDFATIRE